MIKEQKDGKCLIDLGFYSKEGVLSLREDLIKLMWEITAQGGKDYEMPQQIGSLAELIYLLKE